MAEAHSTAEIGRGWLELGGLISNILLLLA